MATRSAPRTKRKASQAYAAFVDSLGAYGRQGEPYPLTYDSSGNYPIEKLVKQYGQSTTWVYIAINRIANACAQIPIQFQDPDQPGRYLKTDISGLQKLVRQPNPYMGRFDFVEKLFVSLELTGNAYIELAAPTSAGRPTEMYPLPSQYMEVVPDRKTRVRTYNLNVNGKVIPFAPNQIIHLQYANPLSEVFGLAPLTAGQVAVEMDLGALRWNRSFLRKGGWPTGALKTEATLDRNALRRLRQDLKASVNRGAESAGQFLILTNGLAFDKIALTPKEMDWLDARRMSRDEILAIYGVPFAVAGLFSSEQTTARSSGVTQQVKNFYLFTVFPKFEKLCAALNRALVPLFRQSCEAVPDLRGVPALEDDAATKLTLSQAFHTLVTAGWSINAALEELYPHREKFKWGDVAWMNQAQVPISGPKNPFATQAGGGGGGGFGKPPSSGVTPPGLATGSGPPQPTKPGNAKPPNPVNPNATDKRPNPKKKPTKSAIETAKSIATRLDFDPATTEAFCRMVERSTPTNL